MEQNLSFGKPLVYQNEVYFVSSTALFVYSTAKEFFHAVKFCSHFGSIISLLGKESGEP